MRPAFLQITLVDAEGNSESWQRGYVEEMPGVSKDPASVLWGNVALLAGQVAREVEREARAGAASGEAEPSDPCRTGVNAA